MVVRSYNEWVVDKKKEIVCQEGPGKYNEYIRYTFKPYLALTNEEFNETIKGVRRRCTHDLLPNDYLLMDLMATVFKTLINIVADGGCTFVERNISESKNSKESTDDKFLALSAQIKSLTRGDVGRNTMGTEINDGLTEISWRF